MADQDARASNSNTHPPAPLPDFNPMTLPFAPPKPPVIHPILENKKKPNPFAPKVPKTRVEKPVQNEPDVKNDVPAEACLAPQPVVEPPVDQNPARGPRKASQKVMKTSAPKELEEPQSRAAVVEKIVETPPEAEVIVEEAKAEEPKVEVKAVKKAEDNTEEKHEEKHAETHTEKHTEKHAEKPAEKHVGTTAKTTVEKIDNEVQEKTEQIAQAVADEKSVEDTERGETEKTQQVTEGRIGDDRIDMTGGLMGWISKTMTESKILSDVANKARYGMEQVIITLDPGMKGFLARDGVVDLYTALEDHTQIRAVQDGFEKVFANVLVRNVPAAKGNLPETVYGSSYALDICRQRADRIIQSRLVPTDAVVLVYQPFILHLDEKLYASTRLLLKWCNNEFDSISQLLDVDQALFDVLKARSSIEGMSSNDFPITVSAAAKQVYDIKEESWTGPPPPYNFPELLTPAASLVALNFMNSSLKSNK